MVLDLSEAFRNRSFRWLFFGVLVVFIMAGVNSALDLYMFQYFWDLTSDEMWYLQLASVAGLMLGVFLTVALLRYTEKRFGVLLGTIVWAVCQVIPVVLRLLEVFPANGTTALFYTLVAFRFIQGFMVQQALTAFGSMMADVADEHDYQTGARQEGIFFGAIAFSHKATSGFGTFIGGLGLDIIPLADGYGDTVGCGRASADHRPSRAALRPGRRRVFSDFRVVLSTLRPDAGATCRRSCKSSMLDGGRHRRGIPHPPPTLDGGHVPRIATAALRPASRVGAQTGACGVEGIRHVARVGTVDGVGHGVAGPKVPQPDRLGCGTRQGRDGDGGFGETGLRLSRGRHGHAATAARQP